MKTYLEAMLKHLEDNNMGWCFDETGKIWTRQTISLALLTAK